jgi:diguanylate cyclase (GGDEF)-like protein
VKLFKKNIWLLFYFIVFISSMLLSNTLYQKYNAVLNETKIEQIYLTKHYQMALNTLFNEHETLDLLISTEYLQNSKLNINTFETVLSLNPLLTDIWIFSPSGDLEFSTLPNTEFTNLLTNETTRQWFQEALTSDRIVIGRAYLQKSLNKWILPISKKITNQHNETVAIISTGINLNNFYQIHNKATNSFSTVKVILDNGGFPILQTHLTPSKNTDFYNSPISSNTLFNYNINELKTQLIENENTALTEPFIQGTSNSPTKKLLYTISYNTHYKFWVSAEIPYTLALHPFKNYAISSSLLFLLLITSIYLFFRWINNIEKSKIEALTYQTQHDPLTDLPKHQLLNQYFNLQQQQHETPCSLLYIDLDNFKNINDTSGHSCGDKILIEVAKRLKESLNICTGIATRYSGDEFVIVVNQDDKEAIIEYSEYLLKIISRPYYIDLNTFQMTCSIGIARFPYDGNNIETLLSYADNSMFMAKKRKNNYHFFSKDIHSQLMHNTEIEQQLHGAITNKEISIVYQPQLDNQQRLYGVEALVRWNNKKLGFVPPDRFIKIAEDSGLMPELGLYIMHKAMLEISSLKTLEKLDFKLSINVSVKQFMQSSFLKKLLQACIYHAMDKTSITIEITENLFIENLEQLLPTFDEMKKHGILLSLDDFGTGYSSLSMLKKVPFDELKIDKSFVDYITEQKSEKEMLKSIIAMGKNLGISVLAEGVETSEQVKILQNAGCDIFQGYYFSKPLSIDALTAFAIKNRDITEGLLSQA